MLSPQQFNALICRWLQLEPHFSLNDSLSRIGCWNWKLCMTECEPAYYLEMKLFTQSASLSGFGNANQYRSSTSETARAEEIDLLSQGDGVHPDTGVVDYNAYDDLDCLLDDCAVTPSAASANEANHAASGLQFEQCLNQCGGFMHIVLHPTYQVPCVYMRIHTATGTPLTGGQLDVLCQALASTSDSAAGCVEANPDEVCQWVEEEHPHLHTPWYCLHVCGVCDRLALILPSHWCSQIPLAIADKCPENYDVQLYMLSWFGLVGPVVGAPLSLQFHAQIHCLPNSTLLCQSDVYTDAQ